MKRNAQLIVAALAMAGFSGFAYSHGYVTSVENGVAESRVTLCKYAAKGTNEKNTGCGAIQYEPQSVEGPDGFPEFGPSDGKIASAETSLASALDEQTIDRWVKRPIQAGLQTFEWTFTANHTTKDWKYYITKADWNPNQPLARSSFDLTPFCVVDGNMVQPPKRVTHLCDVPEREGYQVILAVWDVGDTAAAFYNVIDVKFDGEDSTSSEWKMAGQINPAMNLSVGDRVYTRVFDTAGENSAYSTSLEIETEEMQQPNVWAYHLAQKINQTQTLIRAGQVNDKQEFVPVYGTNSIYLSTNSSLKSVEIGYDIVSPEPIYSLTISGLEPEYEIDGESILLALSLIAEGNITVELTVYNHSQQALASWKQELADGEVKSPSLMLSQLESGHHMLVATVKDSEGNLKDQQTLDFMLVESSEPPATGDYEFIFPKNLGEYVSGTKVLSSDGSVYQCKPWPYSGYCQQWSKSANQYEPGVGSHWQMAWDKL